MSLSLKEEPELLGEYLYWHQKDHIWPEIPAGIKSVGIQRMEIFRNNYQLVMIVEAGPEFDFERDMKLLSTLPRQQEWEAFVARFQKSGPGETSAEKWRLMEKIFNLAQRCKNSFRAGNHAHQNAKPPRNKSSVSDIPSA